VSDDDYSNMKNVYSMWTVVYEIQKAKPLDLPVLWLGVKCAILIRGTTLADSTVLKPKQSAKYL
jgi:hypothetical protein